MIPDPGRLPVACTLTGSEGMDRMARWEQLAVAAPPVVVRDDRALTVRFADRPGVLAELRTLAAAERECCAFLDWQVSTDGQPTLTVTATDPTDLDAVAGLFG